MPPSRESRFGLSFSPTTVIASRFNSSGSIELTEFSASSEYQTYYRGAVHKLHVSDHDIDEANVKSIFHQTISPITESLNEQIGHVPEYAALFLPSIFDSRTRIAAADAIFLDAHYATKTGSSRQAACYGYGFLEGKNLGLPPYECTENGPENFIFVLEYEEEYMYAWLLDVAFELGTYYVKQEKVSKGCGEGYRKVIGKQAYQERINEFVQEFIANQVLPQHKRENIRAIVITGEASTEAITELGIAALNAVGTGVVKLLTEIKPSEVVAHGAAVWARMTQHHPEHFKTHTGNKIPDEQYWAEEEARKAGRSDEHSEL
ncbi:hypothetical protein BKA66DRAFT_462239 [Pyrenochaeta sp. MPI-SDFR-AT-0127]|nr:hypothetical protein BKA66DRAFT_462239 [Pyrenochaeta sp. MPI-SDFR-AT-0127]